MLAVVSFAIVYFIVLEETQIRPTDLNSNSALNDGGKANQSEHTQNQ